jgi:hypothetical protein
MLVNFGADNWVTSHKDLCRKLSNWITTEHTDKMREMFNELDEIMPELNKEIAEEKEIFDYLSLKEFFIVMANYHHFRDCGYKGGCYKDFLHKFIAEISYAKNIPTGEIDENGEEICDSFRNVFMQGSKQKGNIEQRLEIMNNLLDEYLVENCADMIEEIEESDAEEEFSLENAPTELQEFAQNFIDDTKAIECLMLSTDSPCSNFSKEKLSEMVEWYKGNGTTEMLNDCVFYKEIATDNGIEEDDINLPLYVYAVKYIENSGVEIDTDEWISQFRTIAFQEIEADPNNEPSLSSTIALKTSEIIKNIQDYEREVNQ